MKIYNTKYKCLDCGGDMAQEAMPLCDVDKSEMYRVFKCSKCGSEFNHRLTKEERDEMEKKDMYILEEM